MQRYSEAAGTEGSVIEATDGEYILYADHVEAMKRIAVRPSDQVERPAIKSLEEPVSVEKAMLAGRTARVEASVQGSVAVFLVNIQIAGWTESKEYAEGFAKGFNLAAKWMQSALRAWMLGDQVEDTRLLDWLDEQNRKKNESHGTRYGWRYSVNHNRIALEDHYWPPITVREAIRTAMSATPPAA